MFLWAQQSGVKLHFIQPGKPTQNAFIESYNGKFRDACLNEHWFVTIADARRQIEIWRVHYNTVRPHSSLGNRTPEQFRLAGARGCGKDGHCVTLENSSSFPLSHSHGGGDNSINSSLS
jgi:putative transposase